MAKFNLTELNLIIDKPVQRACRQIATKIATDKFNEAKENFLQEFYLHPVTQEILQGEDASSGGLSVEGNLFGFIGFEQGSNPIEILHNFLEQNIIIDPNAKYLRSNKTYNFRVNVPSKEDISKETPMPWGTSRSWVFAIESGISGLNRYLFKKAGRSMGGVQAKGDLPSARGQQYRAQKYMSDLLKFLTRSLND